MRIKNIVYIEWRSGNHVCDRLVLRNIVGGNAPRWMTERLMWRPVFGPYTVTENAQLVVSSLGLVS